MKLKEAIKQAEMDASEEAISIFRFFPEECEIVLKDYQDGNIIFQEGAPLAHVGVIIQGQFSCSWDTAGRDDYTYISSPLSLLGDQAALAELPQYAVTFRAVGKCRVALIRLPDFWLWMERDPACYRTLAAKYLRKLIEQCRVRRSTVADPSNIRVMKFLVWLCRTEGGAKETMPRPLTVHVTRDTMTEAIGHISLRTVNRILSQLRDEGFVSIVRGKPCIRPEQYLLLSKALKNEEGGI